MQSNKLLSGDFTKDSVRLWQSVILQALLDCGNLSRSLDQHYPDWKHRQITEEAREWFRDAGDDFQDVCAMAEMDSGLIRKFAMRVARGDAKAKKSLIEWRDWFRKLKKERVNDIRSED